MSRHYFGQSYEYIAVEYAASGRSSCRGCKQKIDKEELRIGFCLDEDHFSGKYWYHLECFVLKPRHKDIEKNNIKQIIYNLNEIEKADCKLVIKKVQQQLELLRGGKSRKQKSMAKNSKSKKQSDESEHEQLPKKQVSKLKAHKSESEAETPNKKRKKKGKKAVTVSQGYSAAQRKLFKQYCQQFEEKTIGELKEILAANRQSKNGVKKELVEKCADGKLLGQIPLCTSCGGGRLRFDNRTGRYKCPGFMEDTDFINCGARFTIDQVKRVEWVDS